MVESRRLPWNISFFLTVTLALVILLQPGAYFFDDWVQFSSAEHGKWKMDLWESAACTKTERNGTRHVCIGPLSEKELKFRVAAKVSIFTSLLPWSLLSLCLTHRQLRAMVWLLLAHAFFQYLPVIIVLCGFGDRPDFDELGLSVNLSLVVVWTLLLMGCLILSIMYAALCFPRKQPWSQTKHRPVQQIQV